MRRNLLTRVAASSPQGRPLSHALADSAHSGKSTTAAGSVYYGRSLLRFIQVRGVRCCAWTVGHMGFVVALFGDDSRPYAKVSEEELVSLAEQRGVEITVK